MMDDITRSNSLADLAARIRAEHEATAIALARGAEHAMNAGDLLIEAKAQVKHGEWLPWLAENCEMAERTAQLYMRMAKSRARIEANPQHVADLSLRGAMAVIAPPKPDNDGDIDEWAAQQPEEPFTDWDVENHGWMQTKLAHTAGLPVNVQWALGLARDYDLPALAVCSAEEITEASLLIAPYARWQGKSKLEVSDQLGGSISILMAGQALVIALFDEIKAREKLSDDRLAERAAEVIEALSVAKDARKTWWDELRARPISDEAKFEAAAQQLWGAQ
jgi:hypothetical protein